MSTAPDAQHVALLLCALNLLFIAALPRVFFRPGRLNAQWWLTALPFGMAGAALVAAAAGIPLSPGAAAAAVGGAIVEHPPRVRGLILLISVPASAVSIALIAATLGTHQRPLALWHQEDDAPEHIVTHGTYALVRHPFYSAFMLALGACAAAAPGILTVLGLGYGVLRLNATAAREERRLLASPFAAAYRAYASRTRRFLPLPAARRSTARAVERSFVTLIAVLAFAGTANAQGADAPQRMQLQKRTVIDGIACGATGRAYAAVFASGRLESCPLAEETDFGRNRIEAGTWVNLRPDGTLKSVWLIRDTEVQGHRCHGTGYKGWITEFHPDGSLALCYLAAAAIIDGVPCRGASFWGEITGGVKVAFHPNGRLRSCGLSADLARDGILVRRRQRIELDPAGAIIIGQSASSRPART